MNKHPSVSFHSKLILSMLAVSLIPLLLCNVLLLGIFRLQLGSREEREAKLQLFAMCEAMDALYQSCESVCLTLSADATVARGLRGLDDIPSQQVYRALYQATDGLREGAQFELYDAQGAMRFSTSANAAQKVQLPTDWGVLYAAQSAHDAMAVYNADAYGKNADAPRIQYARAICAKDGAPAGYIVASLTGAHLGAAFGGAYSAQNAVLLLDAHWRPVYGAGAPFPAGDAAQLRAQLLGAHPLGTATDDERYTVAEHAPTGYCFVLRQPMALTQGVMRLLYTISLVIIVLCIALCSLISVRLSRQFFTPIEMLHSAMGKVEGGNLDLRVELKRQDELGQLAQSFNHMTARLKNDMQCLLQRQKELNEAQLRMLQAQLNPHFLGNTLDTMKWLAKIKQAPEVALMATDLADILRFSISAEELVTLDREIEMLRRYIDIQKIRFHGKFDFIVNIPEALADCIIPKLMLQPLVENAIIHGLQDRERGRIEISAMEDEGGELCIMVADDGCGMPAEMLERFNMPTPAPREGHLGLYNVHSILRNYYGAHYGLRFKNGEAGGTLITAALPLRRRNTDA